MKVAQYVLPACRTAPQGCAHVNIAKSQRQYNTLPAIVSFQSSSRRTTFKFELTWRERFKLLFRGEIWGQQLVFDGLFNPIKLMVDEPTDEELL